VVQAVEVMGDEPAVVDDDELFERLYPALRRWAAATGPDDMDPDDLVQEAVARVLRRHRLCDLNEPLAYLRRTIVNLAANHRRGMARWRRAVSRLGRGEEGRAPEYSSDLADLLRLAPPARAVLYLVEVEGRTYAEAAALLAITEDAARTRAARARRRLRIDIEGEQ
jgi:RNA polymerase sigma-70 factor (ECF subfamily)